MVCKETFGDSRSEILFAGRMQPAVWKISKAVVTYQNSYATVKLLN